MWQDRAEKLLKSPKIGSRPNFYTGTIPNCHGSIAYVHGLNDAIREFIFEINPFSFTQIPDNSPFCLHHNTWKWYLEDHAQKSNIYNIELGDIILTKGGHSMLFLNKDDEQLNIFHQPTYGKEYETKHIFLDQIENEVNIYKIQN